MSETDERSKRLSTVHVSAGSPLLPRILSSIREVYHRDPEIARWDLEAGRARLDAVFEGDELAGYLLVNRYFDPHFHLGNLIDMQAIRPLLEHPDWCVWVVSLLHGEPNTAHTLEEIGQAAIQAAAAERPDDTCFLVSLSREGDPRSWKLFRALGFREHGASSWLAQIELPDSSGPRRAAGGPEITWWADLAAVPAVEFADAYNDVFGEGMPVLTPENVTAIAARPDFLVELSALCRQQPAGSITAFMIVSSRSRGSGTAHIDCVGIRRPWRGKRYLENGFRFLCERSRAAGIHRFTFVTGRPGVRRYAERQFGARVLDELVWLTRSGGSHCDGTG